MQFYICAVVHCKKPIFKSSIQREKDDGKNEIRFIIKTENLT